MAVIPKDWSIAIEMCDPDIKLFLIISRIAEDTLYTGGFLDLIGFYSLDSIWHDMWEQDNINFL